MKAGARTHAAVRVAELLGSAIGWAVFVGVPAMVGLALWAWGAPCLALGALASSLTGAMMLGGVASQRRQQAAPLLHEGVPAHLPTTLHPGRVPWSERRVDGVRRVRRVFAVRRPDGRRVTAEVVVDGDTQGAWFVVWPAAATTVASSAKGWPVVATPATPGVLAAAPDPEAFAARWADARLRQSVIAAMPADGELAVYPFGVWWRVRGAIDEARLEAAERSLIDVLDACGD